MLQTPKFYNFKSVCVLVQFCHNLDVFKLLFTSTNSGSCFQKRDISVPLRTLSEEEVKKMKLRYYNSAVHRASFALPQFIKEVSKIVCLL